MMTLELYRHSQAEVLTEEFCERLKRGWDEVASFLKTQNKGEICRLAQLEISLLDDTAMAQVHAEFLDDPTPTDVITFEHGELLIGVETAARQAEGFQSSLEREIALYGIHGMLHLAGYDDREEEDAKKMAARQFDLLAKFFPEWS